MVLTDELVAEIAAGLGGVDRDTEYLADLVAYDGIRIAIYQDDRAWLVSVVSPNAVRLKRSAPIYRFLTTYLPRSIVVRDFVKFVIDNVDVVKVKAFYSDAGVCV